MKMHKNDRRSLTSIFGAGSSSQANGAMRGVGGGILLLPEACSLGGATPSAPPP